MENTNNSYKQNLGYQWIKAESGNTYLCPTGAVSADGKTSEDQLRAHCVEESINPHNQ